MEEKLRIRSVTGVDVELTIAGPGGRSYAFVIDWHIRLLVAVAWLFGATYLYSGAVALLPDAGDPDGAYALAVMVPSAAIYLLYHPVLELVMRGRTPGKRIAGIRIVTTDGKVPDAGAILIRNAFRLVDQLPSFYAVGLATAMLTARSVRIGDMAAGTVLVYEPQPPHAGALRGLGEAAIARLGLERAELARDMLDRWDGLEPTTRARLARSLLSAAQRDDSIAAADDAALRRQLAALLE